MEITNAKILPRDKIDAVISGIRKVYLVLVWFTGLYLVFNIFKVIDPLSRGKMLEMGLTFSIFIIICRGLKVRAHWLIPLILISSAYNLFSVFFNSMEPAKDIAEIIAKPVGMLLVLFYAYQLIFFSKTEVKSLFGAKGFNVF
ncbi:MAG: hypothetical protein AABZ15_03810 [Nitrospirota bacterium]